jgi:hypothetical protein
LNAIFLDRRGRKHLTQRWQGLALAGGDGRSHGSRGHHGDCVFCVVVDFVVFWFWARGEVKSRWSSYDDITRIELREMKLFFNNSK